MSTNHRPRESYNFRASIEMPNRGKCGFCRSLRKKCTLASLLDKFDAQMQLKRTAGYLIENVFTDDIAALVSWKAAAHVETPKKKAATP